MNVLREFIEKQLHDKWAGYEIRYPIVNFQIIKYQIMSSALYLGICILSIHLLSHWVAINLMVSLRLLKLDAILSIFWFYLISWMFSCYLSWLRMNCFKIARLLYIEGTCINERKKQKQIRSMCLFIKYKLVKIYPEVIFVGFCIFIIMY